MNFKIEKLESVSAPSKWGYAVGYGAAIGARSVTCLKWNIGCFS